MIGETEKGSALKGKGNEVLSTVAGTEMFTNGLGHAARDFGGRTMKALKTAAVLALAIGLFGIGTAQAWDEVFVTTTYSRPTVYYRTYSPVYYTTYAPATVYVSRPASRVYYTATVT